MVSVLGFCSNRDDGGGGRVGGGGGCSSGVVVVVCGAGAERISWFQSDKKVFYGVYLGGSSGLGVGGDGKSC